jgi:hypothetical protein
MVCTSGVYVSVFKQALGRIMYREGYDTSVLLFGDSAPPGHRSPDFSSGGPVNVCHILTSPRVFATPNFLLVCMTAQVVGKLGVAEDGDSSTAPHAGDVVVSTAMGRGRGGIHSRYYLIGGKYMNRWIRLIVSRFQYRRLHATLRCWRMKRARGDKRERRASMWMMQLTRAAGNSKQWRGRLPPIFDLPHHSARPSSI